MGLTGDTVFAAVGRLLVDFGNPARVFVFARIVGRLWGFVREGVWPANVVFGVLVNIA